MEVHVLPTCYFSMLRWTSPDRYCTHRSELYYLRRPFRRYWVQGSQLRGFAAWDLPIKSTCLLSRRKSLRPDLHLHQSRTSRRPVPLYQDGHESMCSMIDHGQSQALGTRLSLSSWATSLENGHQRVADFEASTRCCIQIVKVQCHFGTMVRTLTTNATWLTGFLLSQGIARGTQERRVPSKRDSDRKLFRGQHQYDVRKPP